MPPFRCPLGGRSLLRPPPPSRSLSSQNPKPPLDSVGPLACRLSSRSVLHFRGPDTIKFLQGLLTNDVTTPNVPFRAPPPIYAALLTPQGRFLYDLVLYRPPGGEVTLDRAGSGPGPDNPGEEFAVMADVDASTVDEVLDCFKSGGGRGRGGGGGAVGSDRIDALGKLLKQAVRKDNKQRFSLLEENGELFIRANQGHSITTISSESLLKPILSADEVPVCVHGTYKKNLESILQSGLKRMSRLHVHFSSGSPADGEVISGMFSIIYYHFTVVISFYLHELKF
ncbi:uncharacterized protein LOC109827712 [Asparagus officinalis]|uniref:uncharacterized protein LOC109827712 n=1 Tax=Asparagus officinalis TaxID=4686 RepID=UPI00098E08F7|nr:uncharacterized protein LOC109827712 [Asparagus officinalis]